MPAEQTPQATSRNNLWLHHLFNGMAYALPMGAIRTICRADRTV